MGGEAAVTVSWSFKKVVIYVRSVNHIKAPHYTCLSILSLKSKEILIVPESKKTRKQPHSAKGTMIRATSTPKIELALTHPI